MNLAKAFAYPFKDPKWGERLGLGALIGLVPILNFSLLGYHIEVARHTARDPEASLPDWSGLGSLFRDGLLLFLALLLLFLPSAIIFSCGTIVYFVGIFGSAMSDHPETILLPMLIYFGFYALGLLLMLACSILLPGMALQFVRHGTFRSCWRLGEIFAWIKGHASSYFTAWVSILASYFAYYFALSIPGMILMFIPCLGWLAYIALALAGTVWMYTVSGRLIGQLDLAIQPIPSLPTEEAA